MRRGGVGTGAQGRPHMPPRPPPLPSAPHGPFSGQVDVPVVVSALAGPAPGDSRSALASETRLRVPVAHHSPRAGSWSHRCAPCASASGWAVSVAARKRTSARAAGPRGESGDRAPRGASRSVGAGQWPCPRGALALMGGPRTQQTPLNSSF